MSYIVCRDCGAENAAGDLVCVGCGKNLFPSPPQREADYLDPPSTVPMHKGKTGKASKPALAPPGSAADPPATAKPVPKAPSALAERFELIELLGEGGMGRVFHARDLKLDEEIAVKMLRPQQGGQLDAILDRFKKEIVTARKISHPNVIRIHDLGESGKEVFISMELLRGGSLADRIREAPLSVKEAIDIAIPITEGLAAAHRQEIIHRDLNPNNVLFTDRGVPKIVDFGIARLMTAESTQGGFLGTPYYMSPEQANGHELTTRSDLYSLGVMLFELFTGKRPFESKSIAELALMHTREKPPRMRPLNSAVPRKLDDIVGRTLEKDPLKRYESAGDLAADLHKVALRL